MVDRGKVGKQLVLVLLVVLQITMAPVILFSLTYLVHVDYEAAQVARLDGELAIEHARLSNA